MIDHAPEPRPASTLILMRRADVHPVEMLMVVRHSAIEFAGGAVVFPGGRVDASDHIGGGEEDRAYRIAAIRETFEETGVLLAHDEVSGDMVSKARARELCEAYRHLVLNGSMTFADMLRDAGLVAMTDRLVPFAHWITPPSRKKRYDTHFFVAAFDADQDILHDDGEVTHATWISPETLLSEAQRDRYKLVFATRMNVERLATFSSVEDAIEATRNTPVVTVRPSSVETPNGRMVRIPADAGYGGELFLSNDPSSI